MRGICFKDEMFEAVIHGRKTVTRRMNRRYNKGEILYLKEPYVIDDGFIFYKYSSVYLCDKRWKNKLFMPERYARYRIEITDVREERLHDITDDECFKEGVYKVIHRIFCDISETLYSVSGHFDLFTTPQLAFAVLHLYAVCALAVSVGKIAYSCCYVSV